MTLGEKRVGFIQIGRFPHPKVRDIMTIGRIVVVPEFQGFGMGVRLMNTIAELYPNDRVRITTSLKPFMKALEHNPSWTCVRSGRVSGGTKTSMLKKVSSNRITATFQFRKNHGGR